MRSFRLSDLGAAAAAVFEDGGAVVDDEFVIKAQLRLPAAPPRDPVVRSVVESLTAAYGACAHEVRRSLSSCLSREPLGKADVVIGDDDLQKAATAGKAVHSGTMIALALPPDVALQLSKHGAVGPGDMHVTLAYFPGSDPANEAKKLRDVALRFAASIQSFEGHVGGFGRFLASETSDGKDVIYASVDSPALGGVRQKLVAAARRAGLSVSMKHGFTPHVTLAYVDPDDPSTLPALRRMPLFFDEIILAGPDRREILRIGKPLPKKRIRKAAGSWFSAAVKANEAMEGVGMALSSSSDAAGDPLRIVAALASLKLLATSGQEQIAPADDLLSEDEEDVGALLEASPDDFGQLPIPVLALAYVGAALHAMWRPEEGTFEHGVEFVPDTKVGASCFEALRARVNTSPEDGTFDVLRRRLDEGAFAVAERLNAANQGDPLVRQVFVEARGGADVESALAQARSKFPEPSLVGAVAA